MSEENARALVRKAEKVLASASGGLTSFFGGRDDKYQSAADILIQAANAFRMERQMVEAGRTFERAAEIQRNNLNDPDDAANTLVDASKVYKTDEPAQAAICLEAAIKQYCARGNFRRAATHKETIALIYDDGLNDKQKAMEAYECAAEWYEGDGAVNLANKLWLKVADLAALNSDYPHAIRNLDKVAEWSVRNETMKYSVKDYFLRAGLCHLAVGDDVQIDRAIQQYLQLDSSFSKEREYNLLVALADALREKDPDAFTDALFKFDQTSRLDSWKTTISMRIKQAIEVEIEGEFA